MPRWSLCALLLVGCQLTTPPDAPEIGSSGPAHVATSDNSSDRADAIEELRRIGPRGLQALFSAYPAAVAALRRGARGDERIERVRTAITSVAKQHDAHFSRLYWYTDLERAKKASARDRKPILSLRLLGRLDQELSCANSRLFRTVIYANEEISSYLRSNFVLHWESVRRVPTVRVEFENGRTLTTTASGNSIHYVLNSEGSLLDAIPGLYGAQPFGDALRRAAELFDEIEELSPPDQLARVRRYHVERIEALSAQRTVDFGRAGLNATERRSLLNEASVTATRINQPMALGPNDPVEIDTEVFAKAPPLSNNFATAGKDSVESGITLTLTPTIARRLPALNPFWLRVSRSSESVVRLDERSNDLLRTHISTPVDGRATTRVRRRLEQNLAIDTTRNEYVLHMAIHHFMKLKPAPPLDAFTRHVYAHLFDAPLHDPWSGLLDRDTYNGLVRHGLSEEEE